MTDEEMAEERATKFTAINFNEPDNYGSEKEVGHFSYCAGFLAGLEAGRLKWHDLRKDPKDLPEYGVEVLDENGDKVRYELEGYAGYSGQLPSLSGWIAYSENEERDVEVDAPVAWCEVPTFNTWLSEDEVKEE